MGALGWINVGLALRCCKSPLGRGVLAILAVLDWLDARKRGISWILFVLNLAVFGWVVERTDTHLGSGAAASRPILFVPVAK